MTATTEPQKLESPAASFQDATAIEPVPDAPGRYRACLGPDWRAPLHPSGGLVTAVALRAMQSALGRPTQHVRTSTTMFVSIVETGPLDVEVEVLREGRRMSQLRATVRNVGSDRIGHVTTAAFGEAREGFAFEWDDPPEAGAPDSHPGLATPPPGAPAMRAPFFEQVDTRRVRMFHSFEKGWEGGRAEAVRWIRFRRAGRLADGRIDPLSFVPLADTMPSAIGQYLGPGHPFFHAPSVDLTVHWFGDTTHDWLLTRARSQWAGDGYVSARTDLWDLERKPVATATQVMLVRFPAPEDLRGR